MKVIIVRSRASDPNVLKIARVLAKNNFNLHLLIWDRTGKLKDIYTDNISIHYCKIRAPSDQLSIVFFLPFWWLYEFLFLLKNADKNTVIHACDLDTLWPAIFIKQLIRIDLNYSIYDFYADNLPKNTPQFFRNFTAFIEKTGLKYNHTTFLVDETRIQQIKDAKYRNIVYIYNTPEDISRDKNFQFRDDRKEMIFFYAGVLHESRGLIQIIKAINQIDRVKFVVAGTGPERYLFEKKEPDLSKNMQYLGWIPHHEVIKQTLNSDCIIALYDPDIPNNRYASPNKLFEAMMCRKPILVNEGSSMADIVRKENCGLVVPYGDVEAIKHAILTLKDPELCTQLGRNGRSAYEQKYSWKIMEERLLTAYSPFA